MVDSIDLGKKIVTKIYDYSNEEDENYKEDEEEIEDEFTEINVFDKKSKKLKKYKNINKVWFDDNYLYLKRETAKNKETIKIDLR